MRYEAVIGFNTKQIWVYDNEEDVYIDPPTDVLNSLPDWREDPDAATSEMEEIANKHPDWLDEGEYWYDCETVI